MKKEENEKRTDVKWKVVTAVSLAGTATLGALYYIQTKDIQEAKKNAELVKRVVGGPLIDRLIKNEEIKLSRIESKINNITKENLTKAMEVVLKEHLNKKENTIETIADFVAVREVLKK